jgi:hypothetical protein
VDGRIRHLQMLAGHFRLEPHLANDHLVEVVNNTMNRKAIVVMSIGARPWFSLAHKWMMLYASRYNYDLIIHDTPLCDLFSPSDFSRFQHYGRCQKIYIRSIFDDYDRVLQLDDTVFLSPLAPDLAEIVPSQCLGAWVEGERFSKGRYLSHHQKLYGLSEPMPKRRFYNSGVTLYSRAHENLFESIDWKTMAKDEFFPTQGYLSYKAYINNFDIFDIGPQFNFVGSFIRRLKACRPDVFFYHLTSALNRQERSVVAEKLDLYFSHLEQSQKR